jgi:hypothetical protein
MLTELRFLSNPVRSKRGRGSGVPARGRALAASLAALLCAAVAAALAFGAVTTGSRSSSTSSAGWDGFGAGNWPGATWRPYADSSPFNQLLGKAAVHPRSAELVANALQWGPPASLTAGEADTTNDYGHPVYYALPTDPVYVLHPTGSWDPSHLAGRHIRVPAGARPAGGSDGHMTIVMPDGWEYDLWRARVPPPGGGRLSFALGGRVRITGNGLGSPATAAEFAGLAGVIRPEELAAGRIDHALFIVLKCTGTGRGFGYGVQYAPHPETGSYVYPARSGGSDCGAANPNLPPLGARFQLAMSGTQIAALHAPAWKTAILTALARYGGYVGDTGGSGFGFMLQSSSTYTSFGAPDRLVEVARSAGLTAWQGRYVFPVADGVSWRRYLRIVVPPVVRPRR